MTVQNVTGAELDTIVAEGQEVTVLFYVDWCGPCRALGPEVEKYAKGHPKKTVVKVNVGTNPEAANKYGVPGLPNLIRIVKGEKVRQIDGFRRLLHEFDESP